MCLCVYVGLYEQKTNLEKAMKAEQEENKKSIDGMCVYCYCACVIFYLTTLQCRYTTLFEQKCIV